MFDILSCHVNSSPNKLTKKNVVSVAEERVENRLNEILKLSSDKVDG